MDVDLRAVHQKMSYLWADGVLMLNGDDKAKRFMRSRIRKTEAFAQSWVNLLLLHY